MDTQDKRLVARLERALVLLTERQKAIFLAATQDATYGEIAGQLGISVADVEHELARALVALDIELGD